MSHTPALDLSKYDLLEAKDKLFAYVCGKAEAWGMDSFCHKEIAWSKEALVTH